MTEKELFYRNVIINDEGREVSVKATKGYGTIIEIVIEHDLGETTIRLSPGGAAAIGIALSDAADVALRS